MVEEVFARLEAAKLRWMAGGLAETAGDILADGQAGTEGQLRLLAQAGLFRQTCLRPEPPGELAAMPLLPEPELPLLPEPLRPAFRQMMREQKGEFARATLGLVAARGVMAHPFDWLPPKDLSGYPDAYIPYGRWKEGIEAKGGSQAAEERLQLVEILRQGLSTADQPYLEGLVAQDRSGKVKACARAFLARLGVIDDTKDATELADFLETSKGIMRLGRQKIGWRKKLNQVQQNRALDLCETVSTAQLAGALDVTMEALADSYVTAPLAHVEPFLEMCARSAPDDILLRYWTRLTQDGKTNAAMLASLSDRFEKGRMRDELRKLLKAGRVSDAHDILLITGPDMGHDLSEELLGAPLYKTRMTDAKAALKDEATANRARNRLEGLAAQLALLLTADHAKRVLRDLEALGFHSADPALRPLTFNIALEGHPP